MKTLAHVVCTVLGISALLAGIPGLVRRQEESRVPRILLARIDDRAQELGEIREQLDRLLDQA